MIPRLLLTSEFSGVATGYGIYAKNLLKGLSESNKYQVAELACYCGEQVDLPWKVYPVLPQNEEQRRIYDSHPQNVFGRQAFEEAVLDFRPTHVLAYRDPWQESYILDSPFRKTFNLIWMPTCDSLQQNKEWYEWFREADALLSYTDFSVKTLKDEAALFSHGEAPMPCSEYFVPMNKDDVKRSFGINPAMKIVGFVGRNQKRKLYPELFGAFREFLDRTGREDIVLWVHTAYPDNAGWDFPKLLQKYDLGQKVVFTYVNDREIMPRPFSGAIQCSNSGWDMRTSSVAGQVPDYEMARIYNAFDYYVQYANLEGLGCPQLEAAACAVPGASVNYSAMEDVSTKLGFDKIDFQLIEEIETGRLIAVPNKESLIHHLTEFFDLPETYRNLKGLEARENYVRHYSWTKTCEKWMSVIDKLPPKPYIEPDIMAPEPFKDLPNAQFVKWLILRVLGRPEKLGTLWETRMLRDLNNGIQERHPFNKKIAYDMCVNMRNRINFWENERSKQGKR